MSPTAKIGFMVGVILLVTVLIGAAYYLGQQANKPSVNIPISVTGEPVPTISIEATSAAELEITPTSEASVSPTLSLTATPSARLN